MGGTSSNPFGKKGKGEGGGKEKKILERHLPLPEKLKDHR